MSRALPKLLRASLCPAVCRGFGAAALVAFALVSAALAFPQCQGLLQHAAWRWTMRALLVLLVLLTLRALWRKRWVSALFHAAMTAILVGGAITQGYAKNWEIWLVDSPIAPTELRQCLVQGERVSLERFEIETYDNGMPKQFRTCLRFPEGPRELAVNQPLRRNGLTFYQMSYAQGQDPYGREVWQTLLLIRKDPGWPVVAAGYCALALATLLLALRTSRATRGPQAEAAP